MYTHQSPVGVVCVPFLPCDTLFCHWYVRDSSPTSILRQTSAPSATTLPLFTGLAMTGKFTTKCIAVIVKVTMNARCIPTNCENCGSRHKWFLIACLTVYNTAIEPSVRLLYI